VVRDANGQSLAYVYSREKPNEAQIAGNPAADQVSMSLRKGRSAPSVRLFVIVDSTQRGPTSRGEPRTVDEAVLLGSE
jgi:hypothetical protein